MALVLAEAATRTTAGASDLNHVYCCDPDLGLCGEDLAAVPDVWDATAPVCVVCDDLDEARVPCSATCTAAKEAVS